MPGDERGAAAWTSMCVALYLALNVAAAAVWEPVHDEGFTWDQALGPVVIPRASDDLVSISDLYRAIDRPTIPLTEVAGRLTIDHGMHPPAYYWLLHAWTRIGGSLRLWIVLPALLAGCLALPAIRRIAGRMNGSEGAGRAAMLLLALSPALSGFLIFARPYGLALCLAVLSTDALFRCRGERLLPKLLFVGLSILGIYTLYHYAFVLGWQLSWLALSALSRSTERRGRRLVEVATYGVVIGLAYLPWLPELLGDLRVTTGSYYFAGLMPLSAWPGALVELVSRLTLGEEWGISMSAALRIALTLVAVATAVGVVISFAPGRASERVRATNPTARLGWATVALVPLSIAAADVWQGTHTLFIPRTSFALVLVLVLLIARAISAPHRALVRRAALGLWVAVFAIANAGNSLARYSEQTGYELLAGQILQHDEEDHLVVLSTTLKGYAIPLLLTLREAGVERVRLACAFDSELLNIEALARDDSVRRISLVNLPVNYWPIHTWTPERLAEAAKRARRLGWTVTREGAGGDEGRQLSIWSSVHVKW